MTPPDDKQDKAEAARIRRRWITLGELLGVAAVVISGLGLYNSWAERRENEAKSQVEAQKASKAAATLTLVATPEDEGRRLKLAPLRDDQPIQGQTIRFASPLGVAPVDTAGDPRIEAAWFQAALLQALDDRQETKGDARLPVLVTTRFLSDGAMAETSALYDIGYAVEGGGFLAGRKVRLKGLSLVGRGDARRLDALWAQRLPPAKKSG